MKILIIDDHSEIRDIIRHYLEKTGICCCSECSSGNEAITMLEAGEKFDLVISDYQMPDGDGLDVMRYLLESKSKLPFILFTSYWGLKTDIPYDSFLGLISKSEPHKLLSMVISLKV
jgi:two-component system OmpR family response regulator